jgi:hypothetical protein
MKFIIDGDGTVSYRMAYDLLRDIASQYTYDGIMFITGLIVGPLSETVLAALKNFEDTGYANWNQVPSVIDEFDMAGEKMYIVADATTRAEKVNYCIDNNIPVIDLTRALYQVTERI